MFENTNSFYEKIFTQLYNSVDRMVSQYNNGDIERNHRNSGGASSLAVVMKELGHSVDLQIYDVDGFDVTDAIIIDGKQFDFFHK